MSGRFCAAACAAAAVMVTLTASGRLAPPVRGAELPGENTLPGMPVVASALPREAALPRGFLTGRQTVFAARDDAGRAPLVDPTGEGALPGGATPRPQPPETALPLGFLAGQANELAQAPAAKAPPEAAPAAAPMAREEGQIEAPADRPWLRFDLQGHLATIRALTFTRDGSRICSGGDDKSVQVWTPAPPGAIGPAWMHERTLRWQVERGSRGRIYALAAGPGVLALAGHGAMGGMGEIVLADPATGEFQRVLLDAERGHRQVVASLAFSPDPERLALASQDLQGQVMIWRRDPQTGLWSGKVLTERDAVRYAEYGPQVLKTLERHRSFVPVVMAGPSAVVAAAFAGEQAAAGAAPVLQWRLERIDIASGAKQFLPGNELHLGQVTALAASRDGARLAAADAAQRLVLWSLADGAAPVRFALPAPALSLAFSDSGRTLLIGTAPAATLQGKASLQVWDVSDLRRPLRRKEYLVEQPVYACGFRPDGQRFAYTQGAEVRVQTWADLAAPAVALKAPARRPQRVAFHRENYHIALGFEGAAGAPPALEQTFDTDRVELGKANALDPNAWRSPDAARGDWSLERLADGTTWLYRGGRRAARLPLKLEYNETVTSACWIPDAAGQPFAVAVGTGGRHFLYVVRLAEQGEAPVLRQFRGHDAAIASVSVSRDRRYLVSCSDDATVRFWKLEDFDRDDRLLNRWGASFEIADGQLTATVVREDGPLYFRGLRHGDALTALRWIDGDNPAALPRVAATPETMLAALREAPWDALVLFEYARGKAAQPSFQSFPAWREIASLFLGANREWAYWTPAGYYDASFEGHKLFGWQVNRGVDRQPDFFLAAQFRQALERPAAMEWLLRAGSLEAAFRQTAQAPPSDADEAVAQQHRVAPRIAILAPQPGQTVRGQVQKVVATVTVREGLTLTPPKVFANGVVAVKRQLVAERLVAQGREREYRYEWEALLPRDPQVLIQAAAATDALSAATASVTVARADPAPLVPTSRRLFLFAAGVNAYRDPQIQRLDFAVNNAAEVARLLKQTAAPLYETEIVSLLDERVTPAMWRFVTQNYVERLRERVSPDDLLVVFLSGHGLRDEEAGDYYYVTAGARMADLMARRYGDCLSFVDLAIFADVPCRKLVVLDTCHSGAVQPIDQHHLKAAVRALQEDMALTLTASDGSQQAVEVKEQKHGRFTYYFLQALEGAADRQGGNRDGVVTLPEVVHFVQRQVEAASAADPVRQFPTAGPADVLPYVYLPLSQTALSSE